jgi:hypothetical protein
VSSKETLTVTGFPASVAGVHESGLLCWLNVGWITLLRKNRLETGEG